MIEKEASAQGVMMKKVVKVLLVWERINSGSEIRSTFNNTPKIILTFR